MKEHHIFKKKDILLSSVQKKKSFSVLDCTNFLEKRSKMPFFIF